MNKILVVQIILLVLFGGVFTSLMYYTDIYEDTKDSIVSIVCLSCIKMYPVPSFIFTFGTVNGNPHPDFVLDNLSKGPIFLTFRKDVCEGCEIMDPLVEEVFNVDFAIGDHEEYIDFEGTTIYFRHINFDHTSEEFKESYYAYGGEGVPMFVAITLGNNSGTIEPYYRLEYGTLGLHDNSARKEFLRNMMREAINYYEQNHDGYIK